jgi:CRISPR-associated protein Csm5
MVADTVYRVTVTALSPLHVGTGERLREGLDFIERDGYLWVADQRALMRAVLAEAEKEKGDLAEVAQAIVGMTLDDLQQAGCLREEHFNLEKKLFRYRLQGRTSTTGKRGELHEQIKDVYGQPYLPGSSLKGALRSTVMRYLAGDDKRKPNIQRKKWRNRPGYDPSVAGQFLEQRYFGWEGTPRGKAPNYDLWRAMQVTDSAPLPATGLALARVIVFPSSSKDEQVGL